MGDLTITVVTDRSIPEGVELTPGWCDCERGECEYLCYPEDGACPCGIGKHHVHNTCGKVVQIG